VDKRRAPAAAVLCADDLAFESGSKPSRRSALAAALCLPPQGFQFDGNLAALGEIVHGFQQIATSAGITDKQRVEQILQQEKLHTCQPE